MASLRIAAATPAQADHISALINALAGYFVPDPTQDSAAPFLASVTPAAISALIDHPACRYYVASNDGSAALAGVIALRQLPARHHVHHLFVAPELHGQGVARACGSTPALPPEMTAMPVVSASIHRCLRSPCMSAWALSRRVLRPRKTAFVLYRCNMTEDEANGLTSGAPRIVILAGHAECSRNAARIAALHRIEGWQWQP